VPCVAEIGFPSLLWPFSVQLTRHGYACAQRHHLGGRELASATSLVVSIDTADEPASAIGELLPALARLVLDGSRLASLRDLGTSLRRLTHLSLQRCGLRDLDGVPALAGLRVLNVAYNHLTDVSGLSFCDSLAEVNLAYNSLADPRCVLELSTCSALKRTVLVGNPVCLEGGMGADAAAYWSDVLPGVQVVLDDAAAAADSTGAWVSQCLLDAGHSAPPPPPAADVPLAPHTPKRPATAGRRPQPHVASVAVGAAPLHAGGQPPLHRVAGSTVDRSPPSAGSSASGSGGGMGDIADTGRPRTSSTTLSAEPSIVRPGTGGSTGDDLAAALDSMAAVSGAVTAGVASLDDASFNTTVLNLSGTDMVDVAPAVATSTAPATPSASANAASGSSLTHGTGAVLFVGSPALSSRRKRASNALNSALGGSFPMGGAALGLDVTAPGRGLMPQSGLPSTAPAATGYGEDLDHTFMGLGSAAGGGGGGGSGLIALLDEALAASPPHRRRPASASAVSSTTSMHSLAASLGILPAHTGLSSAAAAARAASGAASAVNSRPASTGGASIDSSMFGSIAAPAAASSTGVGAPSVRSTGSGGSSGRTALTVTPVELVAMLRAKPKTVPELHSREAFARFFRGFPAAQLRSALSEAYASLPNGERTAKVEARMALVADVVTGGAAAGGEEV